MEVSLSPEFERWLRDRDAYGRLLLASRLDRIRRFDHFGDSRHLGGDLWELRWRGGMRVYYAVVEDDAGVVAFMVWGGSKNGQKRDIARARNILERRA